MLNSVMPKNLRAQSGEDFSVYRHGRHRRDHGEIEELLSLVASVAALAFLLKRAPP